MYNLVPTVEKFRITFRKKIHINFDALSVVRHFYSGINIHVAYISSSMCTIFNYLEIKKFHESKIANCFSFQ